MHGLTAMERVNSHHVVWHEFLNMEVHKEFADHLMGLQKDPDRYFVWDLLQLYENNRVLASILNDLLHPPAQPLLSMYLISAVLVTTNSMSGEAMKHSNHTRQTIRKHTMGTWKTNSVNILINYFNVLKQFLFKICVH